MVSVMDSSGCQVFFRYEDVVLVRISGELARIQLTGPDFSYSIDTTTAEWTKVMLGQHIKVNIQR